jgi:hypothetical protein
LLLDAAIEQSEARFGVTDVGSIQLPAEKLPAR